MMMMMSTGMKVKVDMGSHVASKFMCVGGVHTPHKICFVV